MGQLSTDKFLHRKTLLFKHEQQNENIRRKEIVRGGPLEKLWGWGNFGSQNFFPIVSCLVVGTCLLACYDCICNPLVGGFELLVKKKKKLVDHGKF